MLLCIVMLCEIVKLASIAIRNTGYSEFKVHAIKKLYRDYIAYSDVNVSFYK